METIPEGLLTALDDRLDAMLSGAPGMTEGQRAHGELGLELAPLLAVAGELIRSREWIDERLAPWRLPRLGVAATLGERTLSRMMLPVPPPSPASRPPPPRRLERPRS